MADTSEIGLAPWIGRIAGGLERLATSVRGAPAGVSLATLADQLEVMASHARKAEEAAAAVEVDASGDDRGDAEEPDLHEAGWSEAELARLRADPVGLGKQLADEDPLSWADICKGVETLDCFVARPSPPDATDRELLDQAEAAAAVRTLQRMVLAMQPRLRALEELAAAYPGAGELPRLEDLARALWYAGLLVEVFEEGRQQRAGLPLLDLAERLERRRDPQVSTPLLFADEPATTKGGRREPRQRERMRGCAAALVQAKLDHAAAAGAHLSAEDAAREVAELLWRAGVPKAGAVTVLSWWKGCCRKTGKRPQSELTRATFAYLLEEVPARAIALRDPAARRRGTASDPETGNPIFVDPAAVARARQALKSGAARLTLDEHREVVARLEKGLLVTLRVAAGPLSGEREAGSRSSAHTSGVFVPKAG